MWQTPGTHATSTFHAAHSPDARIPRRPCSPSGTALCTRIISQQRRRRRWSHPSGGLPPPPPPHPSSITLLSSTCCLFLCLLAACILSSFIPQHGDTKRHLPGRDKPILEMPKGGNLMPHPPSPPPPPPSPAPLPLPSVLLQRALSCAGLQAPLAPQCCVYFCVYVCLSFLCMLGRIRR